MYSILPWGTPFLNKCDGTVFLSAGIMQWIESEVLTHKEKQQCPASGCLNFLDAFYYIVVTVSSWHILRVIIHLLELTNFKYESFRH